MKKTLISVDNLEQHICADYGKLYADGALLTPGARDELARRNIQVVYGERPANEHCRQGAGQGCSACAGSVFVAGSGAGGGNPAGMEEVLIGVAAMIKQQYGITDPDKLREMTLNIVRTLQQHIR